MKGTPMRIAVLREAGGLGDVICVEPAVRGLRLAHPEAEIWFAGLPEYRALVAAWPCPPDVYLAVTTGERRDRDAPVDPGRWPYLGAVAGFDRVIDLYCPAFRHERRMGHRTRKSRVRLFCEAAGAPPSAPRLRIADADRHWADGWLAGRGRDADRPLVGLQPISCGVRRNWPRPAWAELARRLRGRGVDVVVFHSFPAPVRGIEGIVAAGLPLPKAAAVVAACDLLVTPDSGFLHLGAALDRPLVTLWGSINPHAVCEFYPRVERLWRPDAARPPGCTAPCYSLRGAVAPACRYGCRLLEQIPVDAVEARCLERLRAAGRDGVTACSSPPMLYQS